MSPELSHEILSWLQQNQKPIYKGAIQGLANQRNLRPVFIERKPGSERNVWLKGALSRKISGTIAEHVLQAWLLGAHRPMLCRFLDELNIAHDDDGTVEKIPGSPPPEKIATAVEALLQQFPAEAVAVYLHSFRGMDPEADWPALRELLEKDVRLHPGPVTS
ncbi:MAG: hypothetical protein ABI839_04715 [Verrucomicrobiota bacterium]